MRTRGASQRSRLINLMLYALVLIAGLALWGTTASADKQSKIVYHNGPVIKADAHIYFIWYGNWNPGTAGSNQATQDVLTGMLSEIGPKSFVPTPYFKINTTYTDATGAAPSGVVSFGGSVIDGSYRFGKDLIPSSIEEIVYYNLDHVTLPYDPAGIYVVVGAADVGRGTGFCSTTNAPAPPIHGHFDFKGSDARYAFIGNPTLCPAQAAPQFVNSGGNLLLTPNGDFAGDAMASTLAHIINVVTTDPQGNAWFDAEGKENAVKCKNTFGQTYTTATGAQANVKFGQHDYLIQQNRVNQDAGYCALKIDNRPVTDDMFVVTDEEKGVMIKLWAEDADDDAMNFTKTTQPKHGTLTALMAARNYAWSYRPVANFSGTDTFTYKANDGELDSNTATVTMTIADGGSFHFSADSYTVSESEGGAIITVARTGGGAGTAYVLFSTSNGTASSSDYIPISQTLTFAEGETSKTIKVPVMDDSESEADETVNLSLSNAGGSGKLGTPATAKLIIKDNDVQLPSISINDTSVSEGNATTDAVLTVKLSAASSVAVKVDYSTADGTAQASADYVAASGTLTFAPGETQKSVAVSIKGDTLDEPEERFFLNLSNPQNATVSDNQGAVTILNDDAPSVQFSSDSYTFNEAAGHVGITIVRTGDTSQPLSVDYQTSDQSALVPCQTNNTGIASDRCDYATVAGTLRFAAGEAQKVVALLLINDAYVEGPEQLSIKLGNPQGAALGSVGTASVTITDDDTQLATENPIDDLDFFLRQLYIDFLGREPEAVGFQFWKQRMTTNCPAGQTCDRIDTAFRFFQSDEFRERGYFVYLFYHAALGRRPSYSEWIMEVSKLNGPKTVPEQEASKAEFVNQFMSRQEFMDFYQGKQTGQTFVDALVQKSGVTPATKQALVDNYAMAGRGGTLRAFLETPEVQAAFMERAFVTMLYFGFLRRNAEPGGFDFWLQKLESTNHDNRFLIGGFLQSDEYRFRFAQLSR